MSNYNKPLNNLETLKLEKFRSYLPNYIEKITINEILFTDALLELTERNWNIDVRASEIQ